MGVVDLLRTMLTVPDERGEPTSARFRMAARRKVRTLLDASDLPALDVAGREGFLFDPRVSALSPGITVLDIESEPLVEARRQYQGKGRFVCGDLTRLPFHDRAFGASVCIGTFYNLPEERLIQEGLREMARVTRPGGKVIAEFRNAENPYMQIASAWGGRYDRSLQGLPIRAYRAETVFNLAADAGLTVRRIHRVGFPFGKWSLMLIIEATPSGGGV
ncbi:MAG: class I SAM-dependent methyltransferase [Candidatus Latescibacterota bacterium]